MSKYIYARVFSRCDLCVRDCLNKMGLVGDLETVRFGFLVFGLGLSCLASVVGVFVFLSTFSQLCIYGQINIQPPSSSSSRCRRRREVLLCDASVCSVCCVVRRRRVFILKPLCDVHMRPNTRASFFLEPQTRHRRKNEHTTTTVLLVCIVSMFCSFLHTRIPPKRSNWIKQTVHACAENINFYKTERQKNGLSLHLSLSQQHHSSQITHLATKHCISSTDGFFFLGRQRGAGTGATIANAKTIVHIQKYA